MHKNILLTNAGSPSESAFITIRRPAGRTLLSQEILPVFCRSHVFKFFKYLGEMGKVIVAQFKGNHADRDIWISKKVSGNINFYLQDIIFNILPGFLLKSRVKYSGLKWT